MNARTIRGTCAALAMVGAMVLGASTSAVAAPHSTLWGPYNLAGQCNADRTLALNGGASKATSCNRDSINGKYYFIAYYY